jgi:hypothetical protein
MIDLQQFCGEMKAISAPWSEGDYSFATNGYALIRVPRRSDIAENEKAPPIMGQNIGSEFGKEPAAWLGIPEFPPPADEECAECGGDGEVRPSTPYNTYDEQECLSCGGRGKSGGINPVQIGGVYFSDRLLAKLLTLPNVKVGVFGPTNTARIMFDGGDGLIMPIK